MIDSKNIKKRTAVYIRVSTIEQDKEGYGKEYQASKIASYIDARDKDLLPTNSEHIYIDAAVSGADPIEERPELGRLLADVRLSSKKPFDVVIVYKIDRFARKLSVLLDIVNEFEDLGLGFISTQESLDTSSPFGKAMLGILGVFSELERDMILERTQSGLEESLKSGTWYKKRRYGYERNNTSGSYSKNTS